MRRLFTSVLQIVVLSAITVLSSGCGGGSFDDASVAFKNNSRSKTVCATWDGVSVSTGGLLPGQTTDYRAANAGTHTIQWTDCRGGALTSIGWPNLVEGSIYTFPYND